MAVSSGLFTRAEFYGKNILKLAPDAFVVVNGAIEPKFISPASTSGVASLDVRGGITSISVTAAVSPPGSNKATIEITAPVYKGLHNEYYVTMPNGTKRSYFTPLMEVKVYMKGFYLVDGNPKYYPVFWGMIVDISEDYSDGTYRISLTCDDLLSWWKYQMLTLNPSATQSMFATISARRYPTIFQAKNPWQIIWSLFIDADFASKDPSNPESPYNFVYPDISSTGLTPTFGNLIDGDPKLRQKIFKDLAFSAIKYWRNRFGYDPDNPQETVNRIPLEMFGLNGPVLGVSTSVDLNLNDTINYLSDNPTVKATNATTSPTLNLNYNLMSYVQPYGALNLYGEGSEAVEHTKLEIATEVCNQVQMEFFVDTNGKIVFKPPFYNLDVNRGGSKQYVIESRNILNFNATINSEEICTFLEVTSPLYQPLPELDAKGFHIDYDLLKQYGLRYQKIAMRYGDNPQVLRLLAAAEMAKTNGRVYQGSVTVPLRPEIRLGYPVYIEHIDAYYYVTGISHSFSFGGTASTTLSLEYRRDRIFDSDGVASGTQGKVLKGYVHRLKDIITIQDDLGKNLANISAELTENANLEDLKKSLTSIGIDPSLLDEIVRKGNSEKDQKSELIKKLQGLINDKIKEKIQSDAGLLSGPSGSGFFYVDKARTTRTGPNSSRPDGKDAAPSGNELVMITKSTIPYTDRKGYKHIGGFPYGANLSLLKDGMELSDDENMAQQMRTRATQLMNSSPDGTSSGSDAATTNTSNTKMDIEGAEDSKSKVISESDVPKFNVDEMNASIKAKNAQATPPDATRVYIPPAAKVTGGTDAFTRNLIRSSENKETNPDAVMNARI